MTFWDTADLVRQLARFLRPEELAQLVQCARSLQVELRAWPLYSQRAYRFKRWVRAVGYWSWRQVVLTRTPGWVAELQQVQDLTLLRCDRLPATIHVEAGRALRHLTLTQCNSVVELSFGSGCPLESLRVLSCFELVRVAFRNTPFLAMVTLFECANLRTWTWDHPPHRLVHARVSGCPLLAAVPMFPALRCGYFVDLPNLKQPLWGHNLLALDVSYTNITSLDPLTVCRHLTSLRAVGCRGLHHIPAEVGSCWRQLAQLHCSYSGLGSFHGLEHHSELKCVVANACPKLTDAEALESCPALESVELAQCARLNPFNPPGSKHLAKLNLEASGWDNGSGAPLFSVYKFFTVSTSLVHCNLRYANLEYENEQFRMGPKPYLPHLLYLDLSYVPLASQGRLHLPDCPALRVLRASGVVDMVEFSSEPFPSLQQLELNYNHKLKVVCLPSHKIHATTAGSPNVTFRTLPQL